VCGELPDGRTSRGRKGGGRLRAGVVYGGLDNTSGGYLYDRTLVEYLRDRGDDVNVISLPERPYRQRLRDNLPGTDSSRLDGQYDVLLQDELCHPSLLVPRRRLDRDCLYSKLETRRPVGDSR